MLGKLLKYEFKSMIRIVLPCYAALLAMAILTKLMNIIGDTIKFFDFFSVISTMLTILIFIAATAATVVIIIIRFYKSMLGDEAYLTFTLPVKRSLHIWAKLICAVTLELGSYIVLAIGSVIMLWGVSLLDFVRNVPEVISQFAEFMGGFTPVIIFDILLAVVFIPAGGVLMFFMPMAFGQLAKRHKLALSFGAFGIMYAALEIFMTIVMVIITMLMDAGVFDGISPQLSITLIATAYLLYFIIISVVFFRITVHLFKNKLNLE